MAKAKDRRCSPLLNQGFVTASICINILGHGCVVGFPAVLLPQLMGPHSSIPVDQEANSWLASIINVPMILGNFLMPSLMDRLGRRNSHILVSLPALVGWLLVVNADSFMMLTFSRILQGLSFGLNLPLRSALIGEYTSPRYRGSFLMLVSFSQASGIFIVHLIGSFLDWQITGLICMFFPFISLVMTLYTPESPSYLAAKSRFQECKDAFRWLRGEGENEELQEMITAQEGSVEESFSFKDALKTLKKKEFYKPVLIMVHSNAAMAFAGGTTMAVYSTLIIGIIAGPKVDVYFWMIFLDGQRIVFNLLAVYVIKKYKRRTMFFSIGGLCIASHLAIAGYVFARNGGYILYDAAWIPILLINVQLFTVGTGMVPLPNVIAGEVFPFEYRAVGGSMSAAAAPIFSFVILKMFPSMLTRIGIQGIYLIYALVMMYMLVVIWFILPETRGKTLQQIEGEFKGISRTDKTQHLMESKSKENDRRKMSVISKHSIVVDM